MTRRLRRLVGGGGSGSGSGRVARSPKARKETTTRPEGHCFRHWIMTPIAPGLTAQHAPGAKRCPAHGPMLLQGLQGVGRTGGLKSTRVAKPGLEKQAIT